MKSSLKFSGHLALTGAAAASLVMAAPDAAALGLGRLHVQSALGEALRAEIEITSITPQEASNLRIRVAPPESYRAANVDYNPVLSNTKAVLERRPDGRQFVRLTSDRGVQEPFVDVILEVSWATGRLVRDYTLLFDPPTMARSPAGNGTTTAAAAAPGYSAPIFSANRAAPDATPASSSRADRRAATREAREARADALREARAALAARHAEAKAKAAETRTADARVTQRGASNAAGSGSGSESDEYRVRSGDTLYRIATRTQRTGVSLDQMLVALYRANPDAFVGKNMNRLRAGAVLAVPDAKAVQGVGEPEARQVIVAQSADFGAYRQRLASAAVSAKPEGNARQASGKVQAAVEDRKQAAAPTPDKLTLSKGAVAGAGAQEDRISKEQARHAADTRVAELSKNVNQLRTLSGAASSAGATPTGPVHAANPSVAAVPAGPAASVMAARPSTTVPAAPSITVANAPAVTTAPPPAVAPVAPAASAALASAGSAVAPPTSSSAVAGAGSAAVPVITAAVKPPVSPAAPKRPTLASKRPVEVPGGFSSMLDDNPLVVGLGALIVALLAAFGIYRFTKRAKKDSGETSFLESRLQPDSFFGASGGQRIDTRDAAGASSSMTYSLSQLDAIGDVDPVAEADVYLAYGRDLQAEEILKEAMRSNPERLAIRTKLLEVYAKRRDTKGFELLATQLFALTRGEGEDWAKAQQLGAEIDPENPLFQPGGAPAQVVHGGEVAEPLGASTMPQSVVPVPSQFGHSMPAPVTDSAFGELDLDLDNPAVGAPTTPGELESTQAFPPEADDDSYIATTHKMPLVSNELDVQPDRRNEPLPFDMSGFSIDLEKPVSTASAAASVGADTATAEIDLPSLDDMDDARDPMVRKLELADEFRQIGDKDGARDLLREVLAKASGTTHSKAQGMLDALG